METGSLQYKIYYTDGSTWDSSMGEPWEAPRAGVQIIVQRHPDPQERPFLCFRGDYYIWRKNQWFAVDLFGYWYYYFVRKLDHPHAVLAGEYATNEEWNEVFDQAQFDKDFFG
jgi:hypothetical protein